MGRGNDFSHIPIIDVGDLVSGRPSQVAVADRLGAACRESGFFYVVGHGVDEGLQRRLRDLSREFFAQDVETKLRIRMALGGRAWRGYFRVGDELTSGKPDQKEGLYFGAELAADDPRVLAGTPLHGPNLFPARPEGLREAVLDYMAALTALGHRLMAGLALGLGLEESYFADHGTADPLTLFRIFNYPPPADPALWGVGEHTDYGLLTILLQDDAGGLEVKSRSRWVPAPPVPGSFVCNIGDMLDRMTGGLYRSTPHRVRNPARATGSRSRSSSTRTSSRRSGRSSCRGEGSRPTTGTSAGTARASTRSRGPTATTCWARSARSSPSCDRRCSDRPGPRGLVGRVGGGPGREARSVDVPHPGPVGTTLHPCPADFMMPPSARQRAAAAPVLGVGSGPRRVGAARDHLPAPLRPPGRSGMRDGRTGQCRHREHHWHRPNRGSSTWLRCPVTDIGYTPSAGEDVGDERYRSSE